MGLSPVHSVNIHKIKSFFSFFNLDLPPFRNYQSAELLSHAAIGDHIHSTHWQQKSISITSLQLQSSRDGNFQTTRIIMVSDFGPWHYLPAHRLLQREGKGSGSLYRILDSSFHYVMSENQSDTMRNELLGKTWLPRTPNFSAWAELKIVMLLNKHAQTLLHWQKLKSKQVFMS